MNILKKFLISLLFLSVEAIAEKSSFDEKNFTYDAFQVILSEGSVFVKSPAAYHNKLFLVLQNKTNIQIMGKVTLGKDKKLKFVMIQPNNSSTIELNGGKNDDYYFYPLSPAAQEVYLQVGKAPYEIPPNKNSP